MNNIEIKGIAKSYNRKTILQNITLSLPVGTIALLGPNGAGKTTLLRILATAIAPDAGEISWGDYQWKDRKKVRSLIGYLPQLFNFYPYLTVKECLEYIAMLKTGTSSRINEPVLSAIQATNLSEVADKRICELSGGMLRRVGIAQAIMSSPKLLLVDEPTAGLDLEECIRFRKCILAESRGKTTIISTHMTTDVESMCQYVAVLFHGEICYFGLTSDFIHLADGFVVEEKVTVSCAEEIRRKYRVVREGQESNQQIQIRYLIPEARTQNINSTLEDAYFLLMDRKTNEK